MFENFYLSHGVKKRNDENKALFRWVTKSFLGTLYLAQLFPLGLAKIMEENVT